MTRSSSQSKAIWGIIAIFVAIAILAVIEPKITQMPPKPDRPDFTFEGVKMAQIDNGDLSWELTSEHAEIDKDKDQILLLKMEGLLYEKGKEVVSIKAPKAVMKMGINK